MLIWMTPTPMPGPAPNGLRPGIRPAADAMLGPGRLHLVRAGYTLLARATWQSSGILPSPVAAAMRTPAQASARP